MSLCVDEERLFTTLAEAEMMMKFLLQGTTCGDYWITYCRFLLHFHIEEVLLRLQDLLAFLFDKLLLDPHLKKVKSYLTTKDFTFL
jgi:hypothetical protein